MARVRFCNVITPCGRYRVGIGIRKHLSVTGIGRELKTSDALLTAGYYIVARGEKKSLNKSYGRTRRTFKDVDRRAKALKRTVAL